MVIARVTTPLMSCLMIISFVYRLYRIESEFWTSLQRNIVWISTAPEVLYADFFYYYARSKWYGGKLVPQVVVTQPAHAKRC